MPEDLTHQAVLLQEAVAALNIRPDGAYVDATFGRGGHARAILERLGPRGRLLALDRDPAAEQWARARFAGDPRFIFQRGCWSRLTDLIAGQGLQGRVQGVLVDCGVSSPQLDDPRRGFSFRQEGPLDMRMDPTTDASAAAWLAAAREDEIDRVLRDFGEERHHRRIARAIVTARRSEPITTTTHLAQLIAAAAPTREPGQHPATRSFQAIRIFINQELAQLQAVLPQALAALAPDGRLVVISFHSLEDRIVKRFMRSQARGEELPPELPVTVGSRTATLRVLGRAQRPTSAETCVNPRARSAVLRVAERLQ